MLDAPELRDHSQAVALTYVEAFTLRRNDLDECMNEFPNAKLKIHKAARRITMQRALLKYLCETVEGRPVRSFATRSAARGFTEVRSELTVEQKLDILIRDRDEKMNKQREAGGRTCGPKQVEPVTRCLSVGDIEFRPVAQFLPEIGGALLPHRRISLRPLYVRAVRIGVIPVGNHTRHLPVVCWPIAKTRS